MAACTTHSPRPGPSAAAAARWPSTLNAAAARRRSISWTSFTSRSSSRISPGSTIPRGPVPLRGPRSRARVSAVSTIRSTSPPPPDAVVDPVALLEQLREPLPQVRERVGLVRPEPLRRTLRTQHRTAPQLDLRIPVGHEEHEARVGTADQDSHAPRLRHARHVEELAVGSIRVVGVPRALEPRGRRKHHHAVAEAVQGCPPPTGEGGRRDAREGIWIGHGPQGSRHPPFSRRGPARSSPCGQVRPRSRGAHRGTRHYRIGMHRMLALAVVGWAVGAGPARAQIVRGVVVEEGSRTPVEGAMVVLTDVEGRVVHRVLTDADGGFIADLDRPGPHLIRVDRIGYESITTDRFDVPGAGDLPGGRRADPPRRAHGTRRGGLAALCPSPGAGPRHRPRMGGSPQGPGGGRLDPQLRHLPVHAAPVRAEPGRGRAPGAERASPLPAQHRARRHT